MRGAGCVLWLWLTRRDRGWFNERTVLWMDAWDRTLTVRDLPPVRYGQVYLLSLVTYGRAAAPPVLPAGALLPVVGDALGRRLGTGVYMLASIVTNRVAAELGRVLLGEPSALGAIRQDRRRDALRVTATDTDGGALTLEVPTGGGPSRSTCSAAPTPREARISSGKHFTRSCFSAHGRFDPTQG